MLAGGIHWRVTLRLVTAVTWTFRGAPGTLFALAATSVVEADVANDAWDWDCAMDCFLDTAVSSIIVALLTPTLFFADTLKSYDVSFFKPLISIEVVPACVRPTCFHDFFPFSLLSTTYSEILSPPSFSGAFHRNSLESSVFHC